MAKLNLEKYKQKLLNLRGRLTGEVERIIQAVQEDTMPTGTVSHVHTHPADEAPDALDVEVDLLRNEQDILRDVEMALARIEDRTYGICQQCKKPIDEQRIDAIPFTPYCVACASKLEQLGGEVTTGRARE
jgi:RNA polymerase-binding transcription factor DksA